jgi:echinoderm microtubule-associated protein-like 6
MPLRCMPAQHHQEDIDDLKFSPDGRKLAVASHDNFIDVYALEERSGNGNGDGGGGGGGGGLYCRRVGRCRGHTSYVTHLE